MLSLSASMGVVALAVICLAAVCMVVGVYIALTTGHGIVVWVSGYKYYVKIGARPSSSLRHPAARCDHD